MTVQNLIIILGDQLSHDLTALQAGDRHHDRVLLGEIADETDYVPHHRKKIAFIFSAMRHFAEELRLQGWQVDYTKLGVYKSFTQWIVAKNAQYNPQKIIGTEASEYRVLQEQKEWQNSVDKPLDILRDERFIVSHNEFEKWAHTRKQMRMEYFYRMVRQKTNILMDGDKPEGGRWNFDHDNRKTAPDKLFLKGPKKFQPDAITQTVMDEILHLFPDRFGALDNFWFGCTKAEAEDALDHFIEYNLPLFGDYQDAMVQGEPFLFHSVLSLYLNIGFLDPLEVCLKAEKAYHSGHAPLNCVEGFIRQILGWREYVRGIYWMKMPHYLTLNELDAQRDLPDFYWTAETKMNCLKTAIDQTIEHAYAHHIHRLMITGNFALLIGVEPRQIHEWYLAVYIDAFEWVELPNTLGMSQFADGGMLGSKPYTAGGNYINKMSDYCKSCFYKVKEKTGPQACPFNALYWDFLIRNEEKLSQNPRLGPVFRTWQKMDTKKQIDTRKSAQEFINSLYD